ncbi:sensor histidine kinase [Chitinimonas naiadis]
MALDRSLRRTLTTRLVAALSVIALVGAAVGYALAERYANLAYDRALFDLATSLAQQVVLRDGVAHLDLPAPAQRVLLTDQFDQIVYRVTDLQTGHILGQHELPAQLAIELPQGAQVQYRDVDSHVGRLRLIRIAPSLGSGGRVLVEVGETRHKRDSLIRDVLFGLIALMGVLMIVSVGMLWRGIASGLAPLAALEAEAARRSLENLSPLEPGLAPREVRGLIHAINLLMARLDEAIGMQRRFTANAAHQLRTPLAALRLQAQLALKDERIVSAHAVLGEIEQSALRASHTAEQLLSLARAESGLAVAASYQLVDLAGLMRNTTEQMVPTALARQIDLGYEGMEEARGIKGNAGLLREMLSNLIDNACRYCPPGSWVTVAVHPEPGRLVISVSDNGPGIPAALREQVFLRFFRGDNVPAEGAGLGLSIVREIAERHGGEVRILASEQGQGCRVLVSLPLS